VAAAIAPHRGALPRAAELHGDFVASFEVRVSGYASITTTMARASDAERDAETIDLLERIAHPMQSRAKEHARLKKISGDTRLEEVHGKSNQSRQIQTSSCCMINWSPRRGSVRPPVCSEDRGRERYSDEHYRLLSWKQPAIRVSRSRRPFFVSPGACVSPSMPACPAAPRSASFGGGIAS